MALINLERERAAFALTNVSQAISGLGENKKYYRSYVEKMPSLILNGGLVAAMAFVKAKKKDEGKQKAYELVYEALNTWLRKPEPGVLQSAETDLVHALIQKNSLEIRLLTRETITMLGWLKRIAKAEIAETADND